MTVVIRMKRMGRTNRPSYRISVTDLRFPRDGRTLESLGHYDPLMPRKEHQISLDVERARFWLSRGAQASETVRSIFKRLGVYQGDWLKVAPKRVRPGRKIATKSRAARLSAKQERAAKKAKRLETRVAAKRAAAKAAKSEKTAEAKA